MRLSFQLLSLSLIFTSSISAQNLSSAPVGEAGLFGAAQGGNPTLNLVMMEIRTSATARFGNEEILGSPYLTENFIKSKVFYGDDVMGDYYVRYNALNSEIEIKETMDTEEKPKRLLADKKIRVKYQGKELKFTTYITKKSETKNGYLSLLSDGEKYQLYHRLAVKYAEGKSAANSMVNPIPSRFAQFVEYYYKIDGVDRIDQLPQKKGKFLKLFPSEIKEDLKTFMEENKINLSEEKDLVKIFEFINQKVSDK